MKRRYCAVGTLASGSLVKLLLVLSSVRPLVCLCSLTTQCPSFGMQLVSLMTQCPSFGMQLVFRVESVFGVHVLSLNALS
jgi:hypothetical protein